MEYRTGVTALEYRSLFRARGSSATGVAQSPVDRDTQWGEWVQKEPRSTVTRVQASLEAGNPIHPVFLTSNTIVCCGPKEKQMRNF